MPVEIVAAPKDRVKGPVKIPVKILIPLVFFIFPAMLAVILGPSLPSLLGFLGTVQ